MEGTNEDWRKGEWRVSETPALAEWRKAMDQGRDDEIDVQQINRNRRLAMDTTQETPFNEEIEAGSADYGERLYGNMPEDKVGFMTNGHKRR